MQDSIKCLTAFIGRSDSSQTLCQVDDSLVIQLLSAIEMCLDRMVYHNHTDAHEAASQVQLLCLACLEAQVSTAVSPLQRPAFQAATMLLQRAFEASGKQHAHSTLNRVLELLTGGAGAVYAGLTALLLLLECRSPVLRWVLKKNALTVFHKVLTSLHASSMQAAKQQSQQQLQVHAINSLALRCIESMVAQRADFRHIGPVLHQVTSCVSASTHAVLSQVRAAAKDTKASPAPVVGVLQIIAGCCSLVTALMRHRSEAVEAVVATLPYLSRQWLECFSTLATAPGVEEAWRCASCPVIMCFFATFTLVINERIACE